jgi:retron-type reverse transcriptase
MRTLLRQAESQTFGHCEIFSKWSASIFQTFHRELRTESNYSNLLPFFNMKKSTESIIKEWDRYYTTKNVTEDLKKILLDYAEVLLDKGVPVIYDLDHLCALLGLKRCYVVSVIFDSKSHYRLFKIKKRSGGFREICAPYPALIYMQNWIYKEILLKFKVNGSAHGFVKKRSILTNAIVHKGQNYLLKMDLKDFFPSISINWVVNVFKEIGYTNDVAFYLASICCLEEVLPQGAPTSPMLSNVVASFMDKRLYKLCQEYKYNYTRYADDIAISGKYISSSFIGIATKVIQECGFVVNEKKTRLYGEKGNKIITGISLANNDVRIPRSYRRSLEQELYYIQKYGFDAHVKRSKIKTSNYLQSIMGKLNYWLMVEPQNEAARKAYEYLFPIYKEKVVDFKY